MNGRRLGRVHRALRRRLGLTQAQVSAAARVQRNKISEFENGDLRRLTIPELERCFESMDASLRLIADWHGAALDRLLDEAHATLVGNVAAELRKLGWLIEFEVSFARYGERGSIDLLAWHAASRTLLVVEVKSELGSLEGLLRPLDIKMRWAPTIAGERFAWAATVVAKLVVLADGTTARRNAARHAEVLDLALPARTRDVRRWLRRPFGSVSGLMYLPNSQLVGTNRNPSGMGRIRRGRIRTIPPQTAA